MGNFNATTRVLVAAFVVVLLGLPAAGLAADGGLERTEAAAGTEAGGINLTVKRGAWLGRTVRIRGNAEGLENQTVAIERRSRGQGWTPVDSVKVAGDGTFATRWTPVAAGRHQLRAYVSSASSAEGLGASASSAVERVTVYRKLMASWYGPGFYGNRTACGQRLKRSTLGVAHKTLPCGTKVAIRYEGRSIVVPVIDRGPYASGISYDLTGATAERLGVTQTVQIGAAALTR